MLNKVSFLIILCMTKTIDGLSFCFNLSLTFTSEDMEPISYRIRSLEVDNLSDCSRECVYEGMCVTFFLQEDDLDCVLVSKPVAELNMVSENGWKGFELPSEARSVSEVEPTPLELWVEQVSSFSSQYDVAPDERWATNIIGPPQLYPQYGDLPGAWAARNWSKGPEWIRVLIAQFLYLIRIDVLEVYNAGGLTEVLASNPGGVWHSVWTTPGLQKITSSRNNSIPLSMTFPTRLLQFTIDGITAQGWVSLDAIKFVGWPA